MLASLRGLFYLIHLITSFFTHRVYIGFYNGLNMVPSWNSLQLAGSSICPSELGNLVLQTVGNIVLTYDYKASTMTIQNFQFFRAEQSCSSNGGQSCSRLRLKSFDDDDTKLWVLLQRMAISVNFGKLPDQKSRFRPRIIVLVQIFRL